MFERLRAHLDHLHWKASAKRILHTLGYSVARVDPGHRVTAETADPYVDQQKISRFVSGDRPELIFDAGANIGQTVKAYRELFPNACIHAFEPLPKAYRQLLLAADAAGNTVPNRVALLDVSGRKKFLSTRGGDNQTSSFLPPADDVGFSFPAHAFELEGVIDVEVTTLDDYCEKKSIDRIDILKMDTQGTELDVLRGAQKLLSRRAITMVYVEIVFAPVYAGNPLYHHMAAFMEEQGLDLFRIYRQCYGVAGRHVGGDALFVERGVMKRYLEDNFGRGQSEAASDTISVAV